MIPDNYEASNSIFEVQLIRRPIKIPHHIMKLAHVISEALPTDHKNRCCQRFLHQVDLDALEDVDDMDE